MRPKVKIIVRSVEDLENPATIASYDDPDECAIRSKTVIAAYSSNPYIESPKRPAEMIGAVGDRFIGSIGTMPMKMLADGKEYETSANPDIYVSEDYRGTGLGLDLLDFGTESSRDGIKLDFYVSKSARAVVGKQGGSVFDITQFALVKHCSTFLEERLSLPGILKAVLFAGLDCLFFFHRVVLGAWVRCKTRGWKFTQADDEDNLAVFSSLVEKDSHRFRNKVDVEFLKWILTNDFAGIDGSDKHLWRVSKGDELIGYVLMRKSGSGRGRIIEWQLPAENEDKTALLLLASAFQQIKTTKAVVISVSASDVEVVNRLKRKLMRIPTQAATVAVSDESPLCRHEGWREQSNWRIRPSMGDSCLY